MKRDHWRSVTLRANKQYLTVPKNAGSLEIRNFEGEQAPPDSFQGREITINSNIIYRNIANPQQIETESIGTLERDHWRSVTLRANKHHLTAPKDARSPQIAI